MDGSVIGATLVTRYDDALDVLRHPAMSAHDRNVDISFGAGRHGRGRVLEFPGRALFHLERRRFAKAEQGVLPTMINGFLIVMDPPDHTRIRRLASRAFTPRVAEAARPMIEKTALELWQNDPEAARRFLTDHSVSHAEEVVRRWKALGEHLLARNRLLDALAAQLFHRVARAPPQRGNLLLSANALDGTELGGRSLRVNEARPRGEGSRGGPGGRF